MVFLNLPDNIPLEQRRGVEGLNTLNQKMLLLKSPVDAITEAISSIYPCSFFEKNAYGQTISPPLFERSSHEQSVYSARTTCCVVYQFRGHSWSIIELLTGRYPFDSGIFLHPISQRLKVRGIVYDESDTGMFIKYRFFNAGELLEVFEFESGGLEGKSPMQEVCNESNVCTLSFSTLTGEEEAELRDFFGENPPDVNCYFESRLRCLNIADIGYPYDFVESFIKEQDAYVPPIIWFPAGQDADDVVLRLKGLSADDFERFSCLLLPI